MDNAQSIDIAIVRLRPLRDRKIKKQEHERIKATIMAIGLIEPLVVFPEGEDYVILDGLQRYRVLLELGVEVVPCILGKQREALTGNRMVNRVSPLQEHRMIKQSLEELDEKTIARTLGTTGIEHRLKSTLLKQLHPDVAAAFDQELIKHTCAREMTHVKPKRQKEILTVMETYKDYTVAFARTLIIKTPLHQREKRSRKRTPWDKNSKKRENLLKKLADADQKHDFYSRLYKQYTIDLLRMAIFARSLLTNKRVRTYLDQHFPDVVTRFEAIIADTQG